MHFQQFEFQYNLNITCTRVDPHHQIIPLVELELAPAFVPLVKSPKSIAFPDDAIVTYSITLVLPL